MKTLKIYSRKILERTKFKQYRFKEKEEFVVYYGGKIIYSNTYQSIDNKMLKIPFVLILNTRSSKCWSTFYERNHSNYKSIKNQELFNINEAIKKNI